MSEQRCGFGPCNCFPAPGLTYCGLRCADADAPAREHEHEPVECRCGHPSCRRRSDESGAGGD